MYDDLGLRQHKHTKGYQKRMVSIIKPHLCVVP